MGGAKKKSKPTSAAQLLELGNIAALFQKSGGWNSWNSLKGI